MMKILAQLQTLMYNDEVGEIDSFSGYWLNCGWDYFDRHQQALALQYQNVQQLQERRGEFDNQIAAVISSISAVVFDHSPDIEIDKEEDEFLDDLGVGFRELSRMGFVTKFFKNLTTATLDGPLTTAFPFRDGTNVKLKLTHQPTDDSKIVNVNRFIAVCLADHRKRFVRSLIEGRAEGERQVLSALEKPERILVKWRRDVAAQTGLIDPENRVLRAVKPTALDGVRIEYVYGTGKFEYPSLNLIVGPLDNRSN